MFEEYPIPTSQSGPNVIAFDYRGNVWFTETGLTPDYRTAWNVAMFDVSEKVFQRIYRANCLLSSSGDRVRPEGEHLVHRVPDGQDRGNCRRSP
jgi:streptogramin lyase